MTKEVKLMNFKEADCYTTCHHKESSAFITIYNKDTDDANKIQVLPVVLKGNSVVSTGIKATIEVNYDEKLEPKDFEQTKNQKTLNLVDIYRVVYFVTSVLNTVDTICVYNVENDDVDVVNAIRDVVNHINNKSILVLNQSYNITNTTLLRTAFEKCGLYDCESFDKWKLLEICEKAKQNLINIISESKESEELKNENN